MTAHDTKAARPHDWRDRVHKHVLQHHLGLFLSGFDPDQAALLDLSTLTDRSTEIFDNLPAWVARRTDIVAEVLTHRNEPKLVVAHVEVQLKQQNDFGWRMLEYYLLLRQRTNLPVLPYALLLYPDTPAIGPRIYREAPLEREVLHLTYYQVSLPSLLAKDYGPSSNLLLASYSALMDAEGADRQLLCRGIAARLLTAGEMSAAGIRSLAALVEAYAPEPIRWQDLPGVEYSQEVQLMATSIERTWADEIVETAQRDGEVRKARHDVLRVLRARFGDVPIALEERVAVLADEEELGRLLERAATVASLSEM